MGASFFRKFPKIPYRFNTASGIETHDMVNIGIKFVISAHARTNLGQYRPYQWLINRRPDVLASLYYGSDEMFWIPLMSGGIYDIHNELPRDDYQLMCHLFLKYKDDPEFIAFGAGNPTVEDMYQFSFQKIAEYRDADGDVVDPTVVTNAHPIKLIDYEYELNEALVNVNILGDIHAPTIRSQFVQAINEVNADLIYGS